MSVAVDFSQHDYLQSGAVLSDCGAYRYRLWRRWSEGTPLVFVMLNPSTADAAHDDPTIRKCIGFAKRFGYGAIEVVNLFAYRATDPDDLKRANYPIGPDNDAHIRAVCRHVTQVVAAWGANVSGPIPLHRAQEVKRLLDELYVQPVALATTKTGQPSHPLMLPYRCTMTPWGRR